MRCRAYENGREDWRRGILKLLVYVSKMAPPAAVGINPMTDWTSRDLEEWAEEASELNKQMFPDE